MADKDAMTHVTVKKPAGGTLASVDVLNGHEYTLEFDPSLCSVEVKGNSLVLAVDDGGTVELHNFFPVVLSGSVHLILPSGDVIDGRDLAASFLLPLEVNPQSSVFAGVEEALLAAERFPLSPEGLPGDAVALPEAPAEEPHAAFSARGIVTPDRHAGELLLLEDLLAPREHPQGERAFAFSSLFDATAAPAPNESLLTEVHVSSPQSQQAEDAGEQLLLAYLRMSSF